MTVVSEDAVVTGDVNQEGGDVNQVATSLQLKQTIKVGDIKANPTLRVEAGRVIFIVQGGKVLALHLEENGGDVTVPLLAAKALGGADPIGYGTSLPGDWRQSGDPEQAFTGWDLVSFERLLALQSGSAAPDEPSTLALKGPVPAGSEPCVWCLVEGKPSPTFWPCCPSRN